LAAGAASIVRSGDLCYTGRNPILRGGLHQWIPKDKAERNSHAGLFVAAPTIEAIDAVRHSVTMQLVAMSQWATEHECRECLRSVATSMEGLFQSISHHAATGQMHPFFHVALSEGEGPVLLEPRVVRLGVYPVAADPMHWGHILVGLTAMASMRLDKMIFIIAGADPRKPSMTPAETRHRLGRSVIETFHPLFAYSPLALGNDLDGETNLGRLLKLNSHQAMEIFYVAGADHFRRTTPRGEPDTILKLEKVVHESRNDLHKVAAIFIEREGMPRDRDKPETFLEVVVLPPIPLSFSSTAARKALCNDSICVDLVSLPYSCLLQIRTGGLYAGKAECVEELESPL